MILVLDNTDSFVHNVARTIRLAGKPTLVLRSDQVDAPEVRRLAPEAIVLSPGPHGPGQAGCCLDVVRLLAGELPILGVCLGHQTIAAAYGGEVVIGPPLHGIASEIEHDGTGVFADLPPRFRVGRYHSLHVRAATLPPSLQVTATTVDGVVMGIADHCRCVHGVQFHPESLLTDQGQAIIARFVDLVDRHHARVQRLVHHDPSRRPVVWSAPPGQFGLPPRWVVAPQPTPPAAIAHQIVPTISIAATSARQSTLLP